MTDPLDDLPPLDEIPGSDPLGSLDDLSSPSPLDDLSSPGSLQELPASGGLEELSSDQLGGQPQAEELAAPAGPSAVPKLVGAVVGLAALAVPSALLALAVVGSLGGGNPPTVEMVQLAANAGGSSGSTNVRDVPNYQELGQKAGGVNATLAGVSDAVKGRLAPLDDPILARLLADTNTQIETESRNVIPPAERWKIQFPEEQTELQYSFLLDFFGIELGVVGDDGQLHYGYNLSKDKPGTRTGPPGQEKRLYFSWERGNYIEADRNLLAKAGVDVAGKVILQFYSEITEGRLAALEAEYANRKPAEILLTRFGIKSAPEGFTFYVVEQQPLK